MPPTAVAPDSRQPSKPVSRRKTLLFGLITGVLAIVVLLVLAEGIARVIIGSRYGRQVEFRTRGEGGSSEYKYDPLLGWKLTPGRRDRVTEGGSQPDTTNAQGFRSDHDFTAEVPSGRYRIVFLGDSFTHGTGGDAETFPAQVEALVPKIEAVNMGHPAYGIDQLYLWYKRDGTLLKTNLLLFAFIEDDFNRMTSDTFLLFRPKPKLVARGDKLDVLNVPVPRWNTFLTNTALYKVLHKAGERYASRYELFPTVDLIFRDLKALSEERHQELVLVYLPSLNDGLGSPHPPREIAAHAEQIAKSRQILFWNLTSMFDGLSTTEIAAHFAKDQHYNGRGNRLAATTLVHLLRERFPDLR